MNSSEKFVMLAFQIPPVAGKLLAGGLQKVAGRSRHNVARDRAFDVFGLGFGNRPDLGAVETFARGQTPATITLGQPD